MTWLVEIITSRCMDPSVQAKLKWICDVVCCYERKIEKTNGTESC
jgi:hypothetical protein